MWAWSGRGLTSYSMNSSRGQFAFSSQVEEAKYVRREYDALHSRVDAADFEAEHRILSRQAQDLCTPTHPIANQDTLVEVIGVC